VTNKKISDLNVKIFADGADLSVMLALYKLPYIKGFTTNPTLMHKAGIQNYEIFAKEILTQISGCSISFEVLSDNFSDMKRQALKIAQWNESNNTIYVKIPVMNTQGKSTYELIAELAKEGVKQNITAIMTIEQVTHVSKALGNELPAYVSIFAGRIADTGIDPLVIMREALSILQSNQELIWASPRELLNVFQADAIGCHIITATNDIIKKFNLIGKDLHAYSLDTVKMFYQDAQTAGFCL
jgi:transaldolase